MVFLEILVVFLLTGLNGLLALSEMAIVSARKARLEPLAAQGNKGARAALRLIAEPSRFLSTVQIGITLVGILAGAFSGATLAQKLGPLLARIPVLAPYSETTAVVIVVIAITYLSLILGELVPKRIALAASEDIAILVARPMERLARFAAPAVSLLNASTGRVLKLAGLSGKRDTQVTDEEVKSLLAEGAQTGLFEPGEHQMIEGVLRLADRPVRVIMTPRTEIAWVDLAADRETLLKALKDNRYSRIVVGEGTVDCAAGVIQAKDMLAIVLTGGVPDLPSQMAPALFVPEHTSILKLLERFREERVHIAIVVDEYGTTQGLVTPTDVLESIAGSLPDRGDEEEEPPLIQRTDGSWLADGRLPIDEFEDRTGLRGARENGRYHTLGGYITHVLGHLPQAGESFVRNGVRFEVVDMDGRRIDKVLVAPET